MKGTVFSIMVKMAMILFLFELVMTFMVPFASAEFYVLIFSMILMLAIIVFCFIKTRKEKANENQNR